MPGLKRHPSRLEIEAWFDGEESETLAWHLASCSSCYRYVNLLARIRGAVRSLPVGEFVAFDPAEMEPYEPSLPIDPVGPRGEGRRGRVLALAAVPVALLLAAGLTVGIGTGAVHGTLSFGRAPAASGSGGSGTSGPGGSSSSAGAVGGSSTGAGSPGGATGSAPVPSHGASSATSSSGTGPALVGAGGPLRLAVVVPTQGAGAAEGTEVAAAVQKAVDEANKSGGVNGAPVSLQVVAAEDGAAQAALAGAVDAVVGGFGISGPLAVPWVVPADPWASGSGVVPAELSPRQAGARLGQDLIQRGDNGTVGVIEGTGPDVALADGLASEVPVSVVQAPSDGACLPAVTTLEQQDVVALAVAGSPSLAASCLSALASTTWAPPGGVLVAPSAAYAGVGSGVAGSGAYTVLGFPWPASSTPGAEQFRAALPGVTSYRALVSYAAATLAIEVARTDGGFSLPALAAGTWNSSLYDFSGTSNVGAQVVEATPDGWSAAA